jgi:hypothetical protein
MSIERRAYQNEALRAFALSHRRFWAMLWERQSGKSTTFGDMAIYEMLRKPGHLVIYASASLTMATELPHKIGERFAMSFEALIEKEARVLREVAERAGAEASRQGCEFSAGDSQKERKTRLSAQDFAELFALQRLEFRVRHSATTVSRMKVIAPNPATARSWSGTVLLDEVAFVRDLRALMTAALPIISARKDFKLIMATTPPEFDDTHYSFELLAPQAGAKFEPNPAGNWYVSESGVHVHRVDAFDSHLAGKKIFDLDAGEELTPEEAFRRAPNKDGHRIAHWLWWTTGGVAACDLLALKAAQERGAGQCATFQIANDFEFAQALAWLREHLDKTAPVGLGLDKATSTKATSNPTVLAVMEDHTPDKVVRAFFIWRERDPDRANERIARVLDMVEARPGGRARALAIDATNERYDAESQKKLFQRRLPVMLVVASESVDKPGLDKPTNWKEYLGDQYVALLHDNHLVLPPEAYVRQDHRLVLKDRGRYVCDPDKEGRHGDTFDAAKLALHAITWRRGLGRAMAVSVGSYESVMA